MAASLGIPSTGARLWEPVPEANRVLGQRCNARDNRSHCGVEPDAGFTQFLQIVDLSEACVIPGEKGLHCLFDCLLTVEQCRSNQRRWSGQHQGRGVEICFRPEKPFLGVGQENEIKLLPKAISPRGGSSMAKKPSGATACRNRFASRQAHRQRCRSRGEPGTPDPQIVTAAGHPLER